MAFDRSKMNLLAASDDSGVRDWHYMTADAAGTVTAAGYFNPMAGEFRIGDMINVISSNAAPFFGRWLVTNNLAGVISILREA